MAKGHPGFRAVAGQIGQQLGVPLERANAILASRTRKASPAARQKNPRLNRVRAAKKRNARAVAFGGY